DGVLRRGRRGGRSIVVQRGRDEARGERADERQGGEHGDERGSGLRAHGGWHRRGRRSEIVRGRVRTTIDDLCSSGAPTRPPRTTTRRCRATWTGGAAGS